MITLRQIQFALAVSRHRHFKRAAEECEVSQSALSLGIAEMEKNLGVAIFERNNKHVVVTPIGEELLERAQQIYLDVQQLMHRAHAGHGDLTFGMSIGFIPTVSPYLLPSALPILRKQYPNFQMNVREDFSDRLMLAVQNGLLDAAVVALPIDTMGLDCTVFAEERFYVLIHESQSLAKSSQIKLEQLRHESLLLLGDGHCLKEQVMELCRFNFAKDQFRDASLSTLIHMVQNNMGMTLVPQMALSILRGYPQIRALPLDQKGPHRRLALVTRNNYPRMEELKLLIEIFQSALHKISSP